jgi:hypothetical protein
MPKRLHLNFFVVIIISSFSSKAGKLCRQIFLAYFND